MAGESDNGLAGYNGGELTITAVIFLVLTGLSVGLRTYVRGFMTNSFQVDDWLMLVAQVSFAPDGYLRSANGHDHGKLNFENTGELHCILRLYLGWCPCLWPGTS